MQLRDLASGPNLRLAWRRITTGGNPQYKRFYRELYYAYEVSLKENLRDLRQRVLGSTYQPTHPERIYLPKSSGLHRPLGLLVLEDQIILQAFANLAARKLQHKRAPLQFNSVFSNILQDEDSIFFFRSWQQTYAAFQTKIREEYQRGLRWVGDFDLAAFYDTISHELLLKTIYPRSASPDLDWMRGCLRTWSSDRPTLEHGHGLPQGPIASDFLAEALLLPIDQALRGLDGYTRYVDDVRLLGATEDDVRASLIQLERHCLERGLIPQTGKFSIRPAKRLQDALGMLPSIADPHRDHSAEPIRSPQALRLFRSALAGRPQRIADKSRVRFVLFRAQPESRLLRLATTLAPRHPEHTDAFFFYFGRFGFRRPIERLCLSLLESPYAYVRGEAWHVLARYLDHASSQSRERIDALIEGAMQLAKASGTTNLAERWGACHFLCRAELLTKKRLSRHTRHQPALAQAFLVPALPDAAYELDDVVTSFLRASSPEPGLALSAALHARGLTPKDLGCTSKELPTQVSNTLRELGLVDSPKLKVDPIAEALHQRYGVTQTKSWHQLLGDEYVHALGLLRQAEAVFNSGRSYWLASQNSFNQTIFIALQKHLRSSGHPATCTIVSKNGTLVDYGVTLDPQGPFSRNCPNLARCFREINSRRNHLPVAHPYEKKTAFATRYLARHERDHFVAHLRSAYSDFLALMP